MSTTTVQFEYDPERLIEEVRKRPGIWDFEHVEYRAKNKRHQLWSEVVNTLMAGDVKISKSEMRELELQLQKKWKSIRDCFQKYITHPNRTKRPYLYAKHLTFLKLQKPDSQDAGSTDSDDSRRKRSWKQKKRLKLSRVSSDDDNDAADNSSSHRSVEDSPVDTTRNSSATKLSTDEFVFANVEQARLEPEDPDKLFLLSLLPHLKTIPDEYRLNVKMDMMQVLRNAQYTVVIEK